MGAFKGMRAVMVAWLLIAGLTHADDPTPAGGAQLPPAPAIDPPAPLHQGWAQAVSMMRAPAYFPVPPGTVWPWQPMRLAPVMVPWPAPGPWAPFALLWVPLPTAMPVPVDYGPLMQTPVVELPLPDFALEPAVPGDGTTVLEAAEPGKAGAVTVIEQVRSDAVASPTSAMPEPPVGAPAPVGVDYGPVTPTPVVDLIALEQQMEAASAASRSPERTAPKAPRKQVRTRTPTTTPSTPAQSAAPPVKRRMCWSNGVVAPCR